MKIFRVGRFFLAHRQLPLLYPHMTFPLVLVSLAILGVSQSAFLMRNTVTLTLL